MAKYFYILACLVVVALDIAAGILGMRAEDAQNKEKHLRLLMFECTAPSHAAYVLGLGAVALLVIAHVITNLIGGCSCLKIPTPCTQLSLGCLALTWIIAAISLSLLVMGTMSNHKSRTSCGLTRHHFLSYGGMLCMVHAAVSVAYYVTSSCKFC